VHELGAAKRAAHLRAVADRLVRKSATPGARNRGSRGASRAQERRIAAEAKTHSRRRSSAGGMAVCVRQGRARLLRSLRGRSPSARQITALLGRCASGA
jgi:hypothetical protein